MARRARGYLARWVISNAILGQYPDFMLRELPLGVEARIREVPLHRAVAERLIAALSAFEFKRLFVELTVKSTPDMEELMMGITEDIKRLLSTGEVELVRANYRVGHDLTAPVERTVEISLGKYRYQETLQHLITRCLEEKQENISKALAGKAAINCVVALDTRSLLQAPFEARSE